MRTRCEEVTLRASGSPKLKQHDGLMCPGLVKVGGQCGSMGKRGSRRQPWKILSDTAQVEGL